MKSPYYCKIRDIPIKVIETSTGRKYYVFNMQTGEMELSTRFDNEVFGGIAGSETNLDELTKEAFEKQITIMRNRLEMNKMIPFYCIVADSLAIKVINKKGLSGKLIPTSYVFNKKTDEFEYNMSYRTKAYGEEGNVKYVTKEEFDSYIESIKKTPL
ncbi:MAG: hypothetical protein MI974_26120 [Chitinophagales bacterium]|nr:hypothetical protein [Chitinophagales bacterium]